MVGVIKVRRPSKIGVLFSAETPKNSVFEVQKPAAGGKKLGYLDFLATNPPLLSVILEQGGGLLLEFGLILCKAPQIASHATQEWNYIDSNRFRRFGVLYTGYLTDLR